MADSSPTPGIPRWVKVFGIIALILLLLFVILQLAGRMGEHGPGRHASSDQIANQSWAIVSSTADPWLSTGDQPCA